MVLPRLKKRNYNMLFLYFYILAVYTVPIVKSSLSVNTFTLYSLFGVGMFNLIIQTKKVKIYTYFGWYMSFIVLSLFSCLYAYDFNVALNGVYDLLVVLGITAASIYLIKTKEEIIRIFVCFSMSGLIVFFGLMVTNQLITEYRLGNELFGNANTFAMFVMISLICSLWLLIYSKSGFRIIYIVTVMSQFYLLLLSGGRKFVIIPIVFLYLILLQNTNRENQKNIIKKTIIILFIVGIVYYIMITVPIIYNNIGCRVESLVDASFGRGELDNSDYTRKIMVERGWELFQSNPILGYGNNNYFVISGFNTYSHNNFIETLVNFGFIGFSLYYYFYIYLLVKLWKITGTEEKKYRDFFIGFVISLMILEMGSVTYNLPFIHIFLALGSWFVIHERDSMKGRQC